MFEKYVFDQLNYNLLQIYNKRNIVSNIFKLSMIAFGHTSKIIALLLYIRGYYMKYQTDIKCFNTRNLGNQMEMTMKISKIVFAIR